MNSDGLPCVDIVEQPKARALRFRYITEGEKAGNLQGVNSTAERITYPAIRIRNCNGCQAQVYVSCVTALEPYHAHPHRLVGTDCTNGVCIVTVPQLQSDTVIQVARVGIQCSKQKPADIKNNLDERHQIAKDPFGAGPLQGGAFDLTTVRLCFQCFVLPKNSQQFVPLPPVVSNPIIDKRVAGELLICRLSRSSGSVHGGDEVFLLCNQIKKDVEVIFASKDGKWSAKGEFSASDIHKQVAIVFRTPPYFDASIMQPVVVDMYLYSPSQNEHSDAKPFTYYPTDPDPYRIEAKRKRKADPITNFLTEFSPAIPTTFPQCPRVPFSWPTPTWSSPVNPVPVNPPLHDEYAFRPQMSMTSNQNLFKRHHNPEPTTEAGGMAACARPQPQPNEPMNSAIGQGRCEARTLPQPQLGIRVAVPPGGPEPQAGPAAIQPPFDFYPPAPDVGIKDGDGNADQLLQVDSITANGGACDEPLVNEDLLMNFIFDMIPSNINFDDMLMPAPPPNEDNVHHVRPNDAHGILVPNDTEDSIEVLQLQMLSEAEMYQMNPDHQTDGHDHPHK